LFQDIRNDKKMKIDLFECFIHYLLYIIMAIPDNLLLNFEKIYPESQKVIKNVIMTMVKIEKEDINKYAKLLLEEYYKWLVILSKFGGAMKLSPSVIVDQVWHQHLLFTKNYRETCNMIGGQFLDHYPENADQDNSGERINRYIYTLKCYRDTFGEMKDEVKVLWTLDYEPNPELFD